jgi:hypothetical protein
MKCSIDSNTREIIFLDNSECFGVEFDKNTQRIEFSCPKIVGDNLDLTKCTCRINYMNAKGFRDSYLIDDILVDGDNITFTWALKSKVTAGRGICLFIFCARQVNENGVIEKEWNTTVAKASIKRGLETNSHIEEEYSDILESILLKINSVSLTTAVNAESTNENVPTAKAVYDALQDIDVPSGTPDWAQNDPDGKGYIKNRFGGYDEIVEIVAFTVTVNKSNTEININNVNIDTNKDVIVSINNGDDTTYQWIVEPTETIQVSTGPNQYMSAEQTVYHLGTKDLHDTAWENGDWILTHTLTYRQDGVQFRNTRIKASYDTVNPYFVFKQKINKPVTINQKYTNVLRICFISNGQNWRCDTTYADITEAINAGKLVYADIYENSKFVMRSYLWKNKYTPDPTFISENRVYNQGRDMKLLFFTIDRYNNISTTSKVLLTFIPDMYGEEGILTSYDGRMSVAAPNLAYMTPSMGITKPDSSLPQIVAGDVLSVSSLSSGVPSKWKTTKVDTTVTADSTNLVTSGAVYAAIQEAIANLNNKGE